MATIRRDNIILEVIQKVKGDKDVERATKNVGGLTSSLKGAATAAAGILAADVIRSAVTGLGQMAASAFNLAAGFEQTVIRFKTLTGSLENAQKLIAELDKFSLVTPFEPQQVQAAAQSLLSYGIAQENVIGSLKNLGEISAATGADFNAITEAYGKANARVKVTNETLELFANNGVPILDILADELDTSAAAIIDMASKGEIQFPILEKAIASVTEEGGRFAGALIEQSQSVNGLISTLRGVGTEALKQFGNALLPIAKELLPPLIDGMFRFVDSIKEIAEPVGTLFVQFLRFIRTAAQPMIRAFENLGDAFGFTGDSISIVETALTHLARVFNLVSRAIAFVVNGIAALVRTDTVQRYISAISKLWEQLPIVLTGVVFAIGSVGDAFGNMFERIKLSGQAFLEDLKSVFSVDTLTAIITGNFADIDFSAGNLIRNQRDQIETFGETVVNSYNKGVLDATANRVALNLTKDADVDAAEKSGEELGDAVVEGVKKSVDKGIPAAGSLDALKKNVSELEDQIQSSSPDNPMLESLIQKLVDAKKELDELKKRYDETEQRLTEGARNVSVAPTLSGSQTGGGVVRDPNAEFKERNELIQKGTEQLQKQAEERRKADEDAAKRLEDEKQRRFELAQQVTAAIFDAAQYQLQIEADRINKLIELQTMRIDAIKSKAGEASAESLQLEEERLTKLEELRERSAQKQAALAQTQIIANQALAISEAIVTALEAFKGDPITFIASLVAIGAGIAGLIATVNQAFSGLPAFESGTEYLSVNGAGVDGRGGQLVVAHRGERILTAEQNAKLVGIANSQIPALVERGLMSDAYLQASAGSQSFDDMKKLHKETVNELRYLNRNIGSVVNVSVNDDRVEIRKRKRLLA